MENNEYYEEISYNEWEILCHKSIQFNKIDFIKLKTIYNKSLLKLVYLNSLEREIITIENKADYYEINVLPDEWYIVMRGQKSGLYYKCDQWDGLIKCLDKIIN